jgi:sugar diacid utilization regulator
MNASAQTTTLGMVLTELGGEVRLLIGSEDDLERTVTGASIVTDLPLPADPGVALVCALVSSPADVEHLSARFPKSPSRVLVFTNPSPVPASQLSAYFGGHVVVDTTGLVDPANVILSIARFIDSPDVTVTRRLASLQHSLTKVLSDPEPIVALLARLRSICNATVALVDKRGQPIHSTGPVPQSLLFDQISNTRADTQTLDVDGWRGIADRISDPAAAGDHFGWLLVIARREGFPDSYTVSAVHVAAALVEASRRMTHVARQQERAIRAAVLEEAMALRRTPDNPELAGRIASLGIDFSDELRVVVIRLSRSSSSGRGRPTAKEPAEGFGRSLEAFGISYLLSAHDRFAVLLVQASPATIRRIVVSSADSIQPMHLGVGRAVRGVAEVTDSYHDAQLAIQTLNRRSPGAGLMTYEDLDFATRLFADVGTERMIEWARGFLAPLDDRSQLMDGLTAYFEHGQNMNAAADALMIHHNSLRYRLAKVEELLGLSLREPAAISSVFLALAARDLEGVNAGAQARTARGPRTTQPPDVEAPHRQTDYGTPTPDRLGVVRAPGR